jgi:hypothetical protein
MLFAIGAGEPKRITSLPRHDFFELCRSRLSLERYQTIKNELHARIQGGEVHTSSWIPGSNWEETPFQPIYETACGQNHDLAGRFFGIVLWEVMMEREEAWAFGRYEKDGVPIEGMTYFRVPDLDGR